MLHANGRNGTASKAPWTDSAPESRRRAGLRKGLLCIGLALAASCAAEGEEAADGDTKPASVRRAGPCDAVLRYPTGKEIPDFLRWTYDAGGRALTEKRHDLTSATGFATWTKEWTYDAAGGLERETYVTSDKDEADHDWVWTRDAKGAPLTRVGSTSGYDRESCAWEYSKAAAKPDDYRIFCNFEIDKKDKDGAIEKVIKGTHAEDHTFHNNLPGKAYGVTGSVRREVVIYSDGLGGTPDAEVGFVYDGAGLLLARERDKGLQGYPDQVTRWRYDAKGRRVGEDFDDDADGKLERSTLWSYDDAGNLSRADFDLGADAATDHSWVYGYSCW